MRFYLSNIPQEISLPSTWWLWICCPKPTPWWKIENHPWIFPLLSLPHINNFQICLLLALLFTTTQTHISCLNYSRILLPDLSVLFKTTFHTAARKFYLKHKSNHITPTLKSLQRLSVDKMKSKLLCTQETSWLSLTHFISPASLPATSSLTHLFLLLPPGPWPFCPLYLNVLVRFAFTIYPLPQRHLVFLNSLPAPNFKVL